MLLLLGVQDAQAASPERILDRIEAGVVELRYAGEDLGRNAQSTGSLFPAGEAFSRFEDALFAHLVGDHEQAAERFFVLEAALPKGTPLQRDAAWHMADSAYAAGHVQLAVELLEQIAADDEHPFRASAVRRLLGHHAESGDAAAFWALYNEAVGSEQLETDAGLLYDVGRSLRQIGERDAAREAFEQLTTDASYGLRARYFLGAMAVEEGQLEAATSWFQQNLDVSVDSATHAALRDLSLLALARIAYEQERLEDAAELYGRLSGDSPYLIDALYELVWTQIRLSDLQSALQAIDIFLLRYPESSASGRLEVVRGHLLKQNGDYERAEDVYQKVVQTFEPIREQAAELTSSDASAAKAMTGGGLDSVPAWVLARFASDPDVSQAWHIRREHEEQQAQLNHSSKLVDELREVLSTHNVLLVHHRRMRTQAFAALRLAAEQELALLEVEAQMVSPRGAEARDRARHLQDRRSGISKRLDRLTLASTDAKVLDEDIAALQTVFDELSALKNDQLQERMELEDPLAYRLDALHRSVNEISGLLGDVLDALGQQQGLATKTLGRHLEEEAARVADVREDHSMLADDVATFWSEARQEGGARLDAFLTRAVMEADMGIVDVAWDEKTATSDERLQLLDDRQRVLERLDRTFTDIRRRLQ